MSILELSQILGKTGNVSFDGLCVPVSILDAKRVYGTLRYYVSAGTNAVWINADRVQGVA